MTVKWIGAMLIICTCGGFGFHLSSLQKREETMLRELIEALEYISCELECRLTPLPQLCRKASANSKGKISSVLALFAQELDLQITPDTGICMAAVLDRSHAIPESIMQLLQQLGASFGRFELNGQLKELSSLHRTCSERLTKLNTNKETRYRTYQTLGLCAGAALAILFI